MLRYRDQLVLKNKGSREVKDDTKILNPFKEERSWVRTLIGMGRLQLRS